MILPKTSMTVSDLLIMSKRNDVLLFIVIFAAVFSLTPLFVLGGLTVGFGLVLGIAASLASAALIVRWPLAGVYIAAGCAVLIEEAPLPTPILTDRLYIYYWPPSLEGLIERPIGFLFLFILFVLVCHRLLKHQKMLEGGALLLPFLLYLLCVAGGVLHGLTSGGNLKITVVELRPFWYLFISYLLAYNLVTRISHLRGFFWIVILGAGIKGLQGAYIDFVVLHGNLTGVDVTMSHEESFFFAALLVLLMLLCLHHHYRPQLYAALLALPFVVIALIANQRRADYVALAMAIPVAWMLIFWAKPHARKRLLVIMLIGVVLGIGYVATFSHSSGWFARPAHDIVSAISPESTDTRDTYSNLYRSIENNDLKYTVQQSPVFGLGFGKPYLQPVPLTSIFPGIFAADEYYGYVPHNNIYWVWMRLGAIGFFAFWYLIGAIIVRGCLIARRLRDPYLQLVAIYIIAVVFIEIVVAFADYQLFLYRNVIYVGLLIGILMKLPALDEKKEVVES
ncbi:MAG: hypothetical protein AUI01_05325 [Ktedonobacter sp. 13_2_20CM_2_56_8]|nr:MAG: hypothetical protein AUI01_05325 [Ktedonobacter sp. 13_2_20CM_2_56_8]